MQYRVEICQYLRVILDYSIAKNSQKNKKIVLRQDAAYKNILTYMILVLGILHSKDLSVTKESGIYVTFSRHNALRN